VITHRLTPVIRIEPGAQGKDTFQPMTHFGLPTEDERASHHGAAH
jgi:hypothetical protein